MKTVMVGGLVQHHVTICMPLCLQYPVAWGNYSVEGLMKRRAWRVSLDVLDIAGLYLSRHVKSQVCCTERIGEFP